MHDDKEGEIKKFILISEKCIPVFDFATIYESVMISNNSYLDATYINEKACLKEQRFSPLLEVFDINELIAH